MYFGGKNLHNRMANTLTIRKHVNKSLHKKVQLAKQGDPGPISPHTQCRTETTTGH